MYNCEICNKSFKRKDNYGRHIKSNLHVKKIDNYINSLNNYCEYCKEKYSNQLNHISSKNHFDKVLPYMFGNNKLKYEKFISTDKYIELYDNEKIPELFIYVYDYRKSLN